MAKDIFMTHDFYLAAYLLTQGMLLEDVDRSDPKRARFEFVNGDNREELVKSFYYGRSVCETKSFVNAIKDLKNFLYSDDRVVERKGIRGGKNMDVDELDTAL